MPSRAVPLKLVKAPPITILPSDCRAIAYKGAFAPGTGGKERHVEVTVGVETRRAVALDAVYVRE
jgi:hypothetical protein